MAAPTITLVRGPIALPQTNQIIGRQFGGPYASTVTPARKAVLSIVKTGLTSAYLTAQASTDDGATWTEYPGPAVVKIGGSIPGRPSIPAYGFLRGNKVYAVNSATAGNLSLYAFDHGTYAWSTVIAAFGTYAPTSVGATLFSIGNIIGINSNGYGVCFNYTVPGGGIAKNKYGIITFNVSGAVIGQAEIDDIYTPPDQNITAFRFQGIKADLSVFFCFSINAFPGTTQLTMFEWADGAAPGAVTETFCTQGAVDFATPDLAFGVGSTFGATSVQYLNPTTRTYTLLESVSDLLSNANYPAAPLFSFVDQIAAMGGVSYNTTTRLDVAYEQSLSSWVTPSTNLYNSAPQSGDNSNFMSAFLENRSVSLGVHLKYGIISNVRSSTATEVTLASYYWLVLISLNAPPALAQPGDAGRKPVPIAPNQFDFCLHREFRVFQQIDYERLGCGKLPNCFRVDEREWGGWE